ncbi:hypothetical protein ACFQ0B_69970 [Nonomuraea thailandensis]
MILSPVAFTAPAEAHGGRGHVQKLVKAVSGKNVKKHLWALQAIANAHGGTRVSGTPGFDASRDYVAHKLRRAGYDVTIQPFAFTFDGYITPPVLKRTSGEQKTYTYGFFSDYVAMQDSPPAPSAARCRPWTSCCRPGPPPTPRRRGARRATSPGSRPATSR